MDEKATKLAEMKNDGEYASVIVVSEDFRLEKHFDSAQAGKMFYMYILANSRHVVDFYPFSMRAEYHQNNKVEVCRDVIVHANEASNTLSKYVVKDKFDLVKLAMENLVQKQHKSEKERTLERQYGRAKTRYI